MEESLGCFKEALRLKEADPASYSPLVLAYLGDAVYELAIRTLVVNEGNRQVNKMHKGERFSGEGGEPRWSFCLP